MRSNATGKWGFPSPSLMTYINGVNNDMAYPIEAAAIGLLRLTEETELLSRGLNFASRAVDGARLRWQCDEVFVAMGCSQRDPQADQRQRQDERTTTIKHDSHHKISH